MEPSPNQFAELLTQTLGLIKTRNHVSLQVLQDEIAYEIGRDSGGEYLRYLRKNNVPSSLQDLELLTTELHQRGGFDEQKDVEKFLRYGGHSAPQPFIKTLNGQKNGVPVQPATRVLKPFVAGPPITEPSQFFGRQRELTHIFSRWSAYPLEHIAIIGPQRSGKTSLLHHINTMIQPASALLRPDQKTSWLPADQQLHSILIDFQDIRMRRLESLLEYMLHSFGLPVPSACDLDQFVECVVDSNLPQPTVIMMDNILLGLQADALDMDFWWSMRSLVSHQQSGNLAFLITAPKSPVQVATQMGKPSPFFNIFQTLELGALKEAEARALIESSPIPFEQADKEWILLQGKCWPHPTQLMCQTLYERLARGESTNGWRDEASKLLKPFQDSE